MPINYSISVVQETKTKEFKGRIESLDKLTAKIRQIEKLLIKGEQAVITITYEPVSPEQLEYEKAKRKAIVKEEFDRVMNEVNENE